MSDVKIDRSNFGEYFFDVRQHKPRPGQIMAKYTAVAEFVAGPEKRDMIMILKMNKAYQAAQVMRKIHLAREPDCYRVCREMAEDLASGMTDEQVEEKSYEYVLEAFFYTQKEHLPVGDIHWETIQLLEYDEESKTFKSRVEI